MKFSQKNLELGVNEWLLHSKSTYLVVTNATGDIAFANDYFIDGFLKSGENLLTLNLKDVLHPDDLKGALDGIKACLKDDFTGLFQIINRYKDRDTSRYVSIKWECSVIKKNGWKEPKVVHMGHNLVAVERKATADKFSDKTLNELIDDLQIGVVIQDVDSRILLSNTKAEQLLGVNKNDLYGRSVYDKNWDIIKEDRTKFPAEELPATRAIDTKKHIKDVIMGVFNPETKGYLWFQVDANPDLDKQGDVRRVVTTFIDITARIEVEEQIKKQQQQLQTMMDHSPMVIFMKDTQGKYIFINKMYQDFMGKDLKPGITDYDIFEKDFADWCKEKDKEVVEFDRILNFEHHVEDQIFSETKFPIKDKNGQVYAIGGFSQNITRQKEEQELLRLQESVITSTKDAVIITEAEPLNAPGPKIIYANQAFYDITGYTEDEVIGKSPRILQGEKTDRHELAKLKQALKKWETCEIEVINYKKNGEEFWVNFRVVPVADKDGKYTHWISVQQNITERKRQEKILRDALKEKTTLLAEIHHRVKNNLAIVSGLLELQSMETDSELKLPLQRSINRIHSIAMVHELMYQTEKLSSVNIKNYLDQLIPAIHRTMQMKTDVDINLDLEDYEVNINQAIPLGLLMNELLTNSFKYAFLKIFDGRIDITMKSDKNYLEFTYQDNGPGFKGDNTFHNSKSLGLNLIHAQLDQLHADYDVVTKGRFMLRFKFEISERGPHSNI